jgi:hypothetical protein
MCEQLGYSGGKIIRFPHEHASNPAKIDRGKEILKVDIEDILFSDMLKCICPDAAVWSEPMYALLRLVNRLEYLVQLPLKDLNIRVRGVDRPGSTVFLLDLKTRVPPVWGPAVDPIDEVLVRDIKDSGNFLG